MLSSSPGKNIQKDAAIIFVYLMDYFLIEHSSFALKCQCKPCTHCTLVPLRSTGLNFVSSLTGKIEHRLGKGLNSAQLLYMTLGLTKLDLTS